MREGRLRRRTLLVAATALVAAPARPPGNGAQIGWHAGPAGGRTDPFVTWACETVQLRTGLRVRRVDRLDWADVVCFAHASAGLTGMRPIAWRNGLVGVTRRGAGRAEADHFAAFLASEAATAHALALAARA